MRKKRLKGQDSYQAALTSNFNLKKMRTCVIITVNFKRYISCKESTKNRHSFIMKGDILLIRLKVQGNLQLSIAAA